MGDMTEKSFTPRPVVAASPGGTAPRLPIMILVLAGAGALAQPALGQEFSLLTGAQHTSELGETT